MLVHWIWLATRPGMHDRDKRVILEHFSDPEDVFYAQTDAFRDLEVSRKPVWKPWRTKIFLNRKRSFPIVRIRGFESVPIRMRHTLPG